MTFFHTKMPILRGFDQSACRKRLFMDSILLINIEGVPKKSCLGSGRLEGSQITDFGP